MARMLARIGAVMFALAATVVGITSTVAQADAPERQGWWTVTNPGGLPVNPATVSSDVPKDGLLVQAGPVNPTSPCNCTAFAGLVYEIADGLTASDLTLKVAPQSATTPVATLQVCALVNPTLTPEQGGPLTDAPDYDCKQHATASSSAGDSSFTFHVGSLVSNGLLAIAILPADSTSRVVLAKPDSSSLVTTASTPSSGPTVPSPSSAATSTAQSGGSASSGGGSTLPVTTPQLPQQSAVGRADTGQTPVVAPSPSPLAAAPVAATSSTGHGSKPVAVIVLVAGLAAGAALWALAGRAPAGDLTEA
jgi:hypothetical protein